MMKTICVSPTRALHAALRCGKLGSEDICCVSIEMQQGLYALRFRSDWLFYDSYVDACSGEVLGFSFEPAPSCDESLCENCSRRQEEDTLAKAV